MKKLLFVLAFVATSVFAGQEFTSQQVTGTSTFAISKMEVTTPDGQTKDLSAGVNIIDKVTAQNNTIQSVQTNGPRPYTAGSGSIQGNWVLSKSSVVNGNTVIQDVYQATENWGGVPVQTTTVITLNQTTKFATITQISKMPNGNVGHTVWTSVAN